MKIKKYIKVSSNKYKVILDNNDYLILYDDVVLKFELLLKKEIDDIDKIKEYNNKYVLYDKVLSFISKKIRFEKEIRNYLSKYTNKEEDIEYIIKRLYENNYLNDKKYIKSYINDKINLYLDGPIKIKKSLINLGFNSEEIENELEVFNDDLINERISKYINKSLKNNNKSMYIFKNKMLVNLINLGYLKEDILRNLNLISFDDSNLRLKEEEKLRKKYKNKYTGYELDMFIKRKLYEKGYHD